MVYYAHVATYGQYCGLAKALDVVGDRWTLLIVRELMGRGGLRYTDLRDGLPGIATNLLASRLRSLEKGGVITREAAPPPIATTLFRLTPRGESLRPAIVELGRWGVPLLAEAPETDAFRGHWLSWPVELYLRDPQPDHPATAIQLHAGSEAVVIETANGEIRTRVGVSEHPDAVLSGSPQIVAAALMGSVPLDIARTQGLHFEGDPAVLQRLQPAGQPA